VPKIEIAINVVSRKVSPRGFSKGFPHPWGAAVGSLLPGHVQVRKGCASPSGGGAPDGKGLGAPRIAFDEATHI
jgi:hypothetical protein